MKEKYDTTPYRIATRRPGAEVGALTGAVIIECGQRIHRRRGQRQLQMDPDAWNSQRVRAERELHEPAQSGGEHQPDETAMQPTGDRSLLDDSLASAGAREKRLVPTATSPPMSQSARTVNRRTLTSALTAACEPVRDNWIGPRVSTPSGSLATRDPVGCCRRLSSQ